jgi:uncharacterized protein YkwD
VILLLACAPPQPVVSEVRPALVRYRPGDPLPKLGPAARVDLGLRTAAEELAQQATTLEARPTPDAIRLALGRAGYPGDARFVRVRGGAELPKEILDALPRDLPVDVGWAWRDFPDGARWWVVGWALRYVELDPMPRDVAAGVPFPMRVDGPAGLRLMIGRPDGKVDELDFEADETRWVKLAGGAGEYRVEVIGAEKVALLFSLWADTAPPAPAPLPVPSPVQDPRVATEEIYDRIDSLRAQVGLPALARFPTFEPVARRHAACIAAAGVVAHRTATCPGVPVLASADYRPRARFREDLAVAPDADEAWSLIMASPGHRENLLCTTCTHVAVGAALEPSMAPRLYFALELMEFPEGTPATVWAPR